jgi:hypothetical protein
MAANDNMYAVKVCCTSIEEACKLACIEENAGKYASIEKGPSIDKAASKVAKPALLNLILECINYFLFFSTLRKTISNELQMIMN